jgi:bifunctional non-homologous end joining protein LigD
VTTESVSSERHGEIDYCVVEELPTLVWLANLADIELHTSLSRAAAMERPTAMVFDLDPGAPADVLDCAQVGVWLRGMFEQLGLECYPKTSGSKGMQLYVPLNTKISYEETRPFAQAIAQLIAKQTPEDVLAKMGKKVDRSGKVFIDWYQNNERKTTISVYSLRARERPTVSTPVTWEEVEAATDSGDGSSLVFEAGEVLERIEEHGDLFAPVLEIKQKLPEL